MTLARQNEITTDRRQVDYFLIIGLVFFSSSPMVFQSQPLRLGLMLVLLITVGWTALRRNTQLDMRSIAVALVLCVLTIATPLLTGDPDVSPYLALVGAVILAALLVNLLPLARFSYVYARVLTVLAALSLFFMALGTFLPRLVALLPVVAGTHVDYRFVGVYVYMFNRQAGATELLVQRNSGMAWEPGAFAILLGLAALFTVHQYRGHRLPRSAVISLAVLATAALTTYSVTGMILFLLIILAYFREVFSRPSVGVVVITAAVLVQVVGLSSRSFAVWDRYLNPANPDQTLTNLGARVSLDGVPGVMNSPAFPLGSSYQWLHATEDKLWNSILASIIALGLVFVLVLSWQYLRYTLTFGGRAWIVGLFLLVAFSTENYFVAPLFIALAAYGTITPTRSDGPSFHHEPLSPQIAMEARTRSRRERRGIVALRSRSISFRPSS